MELSPISNANASHVHNASMASPGLGGNVEDDIASTSQLRELLEENPGEGGREVESASTSEIDPSTMVPTPLALAAASDDPWSEGKKFVRGTRILAVRLELSKPLLQRGFKGIDACLVHVQTRPNSRLELFKRRKEDCGSFVVELLRESGQHGLLAAAAKSAYLGEARIHEIPGGANSASGVISTVDPLVVKTDANGIRIADFAFCFADSMFNVMAVDHRALALALGTFLRERCCDGYGKMVSSFDGMMNIINNSNEFPFDLARCTNRRLPGIDDGNLEHKMQYLFALSKQKSTRMFVIQCVAKDGSSSHFVGLRNGIIYDNCAATGGKLDAREYAEENLSGVRKAAEIILYHPSSKKKKKTKKNQKRGLTSTPEQDESGGVQQKKARFDL